MDWTIKFSEISVKQLKKMDKHIVKKIRDYLVEKIKTGEPKSFAKPLVANKTGLWRYRIEDYRVICEIKDQELIIFVLRVDHRRKIYD